MQNASMLQGHARWVALALVIAGCSAKEGAPATEEAPGPDAGVPSPDAAIGDAGGVNVAFTQALIEDLKGRGFQVGQGSPILYQASDCERFTYAVTTNCYGNNPAAPYVAVTVPPWPDEYQDPAIASVMGGVVPGNTGVYRFAPQEAIVVYGRMPPPGKYFSLQTWVYSQEGRWKQSDYDYWASQNPAVPMQYLFDTLPADDPAATRVQSFSMLSNVVNNVVIERQSGGSFGTIRYFVITPDGAMDAAIRSALAARGVADKDIFTEPIPQRDPIGSIGPIGLDKQANDFVTLMRYAVPEDPTAGQAWRTELPLTMLRVRGSGSAPSNPYPLFTPEPRTAVDEVDDAQLQSDFTTLLQSVCNRAQGAPWNFRGSGCETPPPASSIMADLVAGYGWPGWYCRSIGMNCLGDQQEAAYYINQPEPIDNGEVYAVVGTLATKTGNATYAALSVNVPSVFKGADNILDTRLAGSAAAYAGPVKDPDKFFVWYFARDCNAVAPLTDGKCTTLTPETVPLRTDTAAMGDPALKGMFQVGLRDYIKPGTARGPDGKKLITPHVLKFTRS